MSNEIDTIEQFPELPPAWSDWLVTEKIGEGSFGSVYLIEQDGTEQALKIVDVPADDSERAALLVETKSREAAQLYLDDLIGNYLREIEVMYSMREDPHIVRIEDHLVLKNEEKIGYRIFIRMELLTSVRDYFIGKKPSQEDVIRLGMDICDALTACEAHRIIHRDIKPDNIFVTEEGNFKLGDFGTARQLDLSFGTYSAKGTYTYMAPEVNRGERYNKQVDIYSLGIVLYRMMNHNRDPFVDVTRQLVYYQEREEALQRRMDGEALPAPADASEEFSLVIRRACAFHAQNRYACAKDFKAALEKVLSCDGDFEEEQQALARDAQPEEQEEAVAAAMAGTMDTAAAGTVAMTGGEAARTPAGTQKIRRAFRIGIGGLALTAAVICVLVLTGVIRPGRRGSSRGEIQTEFMEEMPAAREDAQAGVIPARDDYHEMEDEMAEALLAAQSLMEELSGLSMAQYEEFASHFVNGDEELISEYFHSFREYGAYDRHIYSAVGACLAGEGDDEETLYYIGISGYNAVADAQMIAAQDSPEEETRGSVRQEEASGEGDMAGAVSGIASDTDAMPTAENTDSIAEYPWILCLKNTGGEWSIDAAMTGRDMAWVTAKEVLDAVPAGYMQENVVNRTSENRDSYSYLSDRAVYDYVATADVKFVWQDEAGNVYITLILRNGTEEERTFCNGHVILNDLDLGTVAEADLPMNVTVQPGYNEMLTYRIDSEDVYTGTQEWVYTNEVLWFEDSEMNIYESHSYSYEEAEPVSEMA